MTDELIAALKTLVAAAHRRYFDDEVAITIAHIEALRSGTERAQIGRKMFDDLRRSQDSHAGVTLDGDEVIALCDAYDAAAILIALGQS